VPGHLVENGTLGAAAAAAPSVVAGDQDDAFVSEFDQALGGIPRGGNVIRSHSGNREFPSSSEESHNGRFLFGEPGENFAWSGADDPGVGGGLSDLLNHPLGIHFEIEEALRGVEWSVPGFFQTVEKVDHGVFLSCRRFIIQNGNTH